MPTPLRVRLDRHVADAHRMLASGDPDRAWALLEEAHVLSQPWARAHMRVHVAMLATAWRTRDRAEFLGQVLRTLVAGPASLAGRYPEGNTGRASVPATQPMPVPAELRALLDLADG